MRVVPVRARRVIRADAVFVLPHLSRLDAESRIVHDEVAVHTGCYLARRHVQPMRVKICAVGIAQMLCRFTAARIGGQLIDDLDSESVAHADAQRWGRDAVVHRAQRDRLAVEHRRQIGKLQRDVE